MLLIVELRSRVNKKREWKNKKFGFGGQKKRSKNNTKDSYNDTSDYRPNKRSKKVCAIFPTIPTKTEL